MADEVETASGVHPIEEWLVEPSGIDVALACVGSKLDEVGGTAVGRVEGALKDAEDGSPTWLVVRLGRFGKRSAVPFDYAAPGVGHVWTPFAKETIRAASELDPAQGFSAAEERALVAHYEVPEGSGRNESLSGRDDEDPSSIPA